MTLSAGDKIGPYTVLEKLGAGGMGEVYKARDTRLERIIALKVLAPDGMQDPECKRRFAQEARSASSLNHHNIVAIYDIGNDNGVDYLAMELVPGKSVDHLIKGTGLHLDEILRYGVQIADALAKAHAAGIVHRDMKPSNVMVTPEGLVKVLDFGLAKSAEKPPPQNDSSARTLTALTAEGSIIGTAAYMAPEQAEARTADCRSDIFSLGAVLYEMATGQRAFQGASQLATLSAVLRDDPAPVSQLVTDLPEEFSRIVSRCLRKDPAKRFQHVEDLKVALEEMKDELDSGKLASAQAARQEPRRWLFAAGVALVVGLAGYFIARKDDSGAPVKVLVPVPITSYPGDQTTPSFSPDGNQVAFSWNSVNQDNYDIYVKLLGPGTPLRLTTDPARDFHPRWSPDGQKIAFLRELPENRVAVMLVPPLGGPDRKITEFYSQVRIRTLASLCWTADSSSLIVSAAPGASDANRLLLVSVDSGDVRTLTNPPPHEADLSPSVSPDGNTLAFSRFNGSVRRLLVVPLAKDHLTQGQPRELPAADPISEPAWTADGRQIIFDSGATHTSQRLYQIAASGGGSPIPLTDAGQGVGSPGLARQGHRLIYERFFQDTNIWAVSLDDPKARMEKRVPSSGQEVFPQYSPDGTKLAFHSDRGGTVQIWTCNLDDSGCVQLTSMTGSTQGTPRWSPDGRRISFDSNTNGYHIYTINAEGSKPQQMTFGTGVDIAASWSHDGQWIYFGSTRSGRFEIWKIPSQGGDPIQVTRNGGTAAVDSPDGKTLYYTKSNGPDGVWKMPLEGGQETQVVKAIWRYNFAVTSKGLYYTPPRSGNGSSTVQFLDFKTGKTTQLAKIEKTVDLGLAVSPDEREVLFSQIDSAGTNLMLIENFR